VKSHFLDVVVLSYVYLQTVNLCSSRVLVLESILHFGVERIRLYAVGCVEHCDWNEAYSDNMLRARPLTMHLHLYIHNADARTMNYIFARLR
jgi:hypothetical protein